MGCFIAAALCPQAHDVDEQALSLYHFQPDAPGPQVGRAGRWRRCGKDRGLLRMGVLEPRVPLCSPHAGTVLATRYPAPANFLQGRQQPSDDPALAALLAADAQQVAADGAAAAGTGFHIVALEVRSLCGFTSGRLRSCPGLTTH